MISFWDGTLTRIDPMTTRVAATIRLTLPFAVCTGCADAHDFLPFDLAVGQGSVWVDTARGVVARIDPSTNRVAGMIKLPAEEPADIAVGEGAVWVAMDLSGVYKIDPSNDHVAARIAVSGSNDRRLGVQEVVVGGGSIWAEGGWARKTGVIGGQSQYVVANGAAISRIDPQTDTSTALFSVGGVQRGMAFDKSALWLSQGTTLERIDPRTGAVTGTVDAPSGGRFVAVGDGAGWAAMPNGSLERVNLPTH